APLKLPPAEFYVVYSGPQKVPEKLSLKNICFNGLGSLELEVNVLNVVDGTIYGEYIGYCKVFDAQRKTYGRSVRCIQETIRICIEKGYLADYLTAHKNEVITMIERLFDEETQRERHDRAVEKRSWEKGRAEGLAEGLAEGHAEGLAEGRLTTLKENAANMRANGIDETIAKFLRVDVVDVKIWLNSEEN
ncbi:MAG: hypothetical protein IKX88_05510, partial [Thermoguttaceae bacterium]|nr:hypothetical protein [Thermoguttaceae bacterium]